MANIVSGDQLKPLSKAESRKANKPMVEKRRRERINSCLEELKGLVLHALQRDTPEHSKLEKADILELTVSHLRNLQKQRASSGAVQWNDSSSKYKSGFGECAAEISRYMSSVPGVDKRVQERIVGHLTSCIRNIPTNQDPNAQLHATQEPIHVKIPVATPSLILPGNNLNENNNNIPALAVMRTSQTSDVTSPNNASSVTPCAVTLPNQGLVYANVQAQPFGLYFINDPQRYAMCSSTSPDTLDLSHRSSRVSGKVKTASGTSIERIRPVWRPW